MERFMFNKVWIDGEQYHAAAVLRATAELKHDRHGKLYPSHNGSECTLLIDSEYAVELFQKVAELQRVDVAVLRGEMVTIGEGLLVTEQSQIEGSIVRMEMRYGRPLRIVKEKEWMEGLR